ncbi:MAG TPA: hypothetical protein VMO00_18440, partial [Methylomirabilota bacterium]|nr:hypothetical protein [Methylomirabilota bacterium]
MRQRPRFKRLIVLYSYIVAVFLLARVAFAADAQDEWKKIVDAAKKEGKVIVGGPPTAVLRKQFQETFEKKFGLELEIISAPGPQNATRAMS